MRFAHHLRFACLLTAALLAGCGDLIGNACTMELGWELSPSSRTLVIGETLRPRGTIVTCGGRDRTPADLTLAVADSAVVTLSPDARSVMAVRVGFAQVQAIDAHYGPLGVVSITVVPRP